MGIALHPNYPNPAWVYLMYTCSGILLYDRISYFLDTGNGLTNEKPLVTRIAAATYHDGGIIRFGPDGMLYAGTGDAGQPESAQNRSSLSGKVLRMTSTGKVLADDLFSSSLVYAYGLRNVQGFAWNPANGELSHRHWQFSTHLTLVPDRDPCGALWPPACCSSGTGWRLVRLHQQLRRTRERQVGR